jgi:two-component system chemotaxis response regulator CheB
VIRGLISRNLESDPEIQVVTTVPNGQMAINALSRYPVEVLILDIEMPVMDGLTALPELIKAQPDLQVIMASTLTRRNADISMRALAAGAADYLAKPTTTMALNAAADFKTELALKVKVLGAARRRAAGLRSPGGRRAPDMPHAPAADAHPTPHHPASGTQPATARSALRAIPGGSRGPISLRPMPTEMPDIVAIGSSTGGPQALMTLVTDLGAVIDRVPVLITQHMPPTFTTILAEHLARSSRRPAHEAIDGEIVKAGTIYLAPGGRHMRVVRHGTDAAIALDDGPPVNFCKPAVDPLFSSAIEVWQGGVLAVVLTGMGSDGMRGGKEIVAAGGSVIAQDEASSVVWGMPGAAAHAGICAAILPLNQIASKLVRVFSGDRS